MAFGNQLLVSSGGGGNMEPIGVPTAVSYVGYVATPYDAYGGGYQHTSKAHFGYDGQSVYFAATLSGDKRIAQWKMATQYDITSMSGTANSTSGYWSTGSAFGQFTYHQNGLEALIAEVNAIMRRGTTATAYNAISGGQYIGSWTYGPAMRNCYIVNAGEYMILFANSGGVNYLEKTLMTDFNSFMGQSTRTSYNLSAYEPAGASTTITFSGASINEGNHLLQWDSLNSQIKVWQNASAFNFSSPTLISTFSIPTSDTTIVGTEAQINMSYQGGYLFAHREGTTRMHQFAFTY